MKKIYIMGEIIIDFIPKEKNIALKDVTAFKKSVGGAPANVACAVAKLGGDVSFISKVGNDAFGKTSIEFLNNCNVNTNNVFTTSKANTALAFVSLDDKGNRDFAFYRNPSADMLLYEDEITDSMLNDCKIFHFGSVNLVDYPSKYAHIKAINKAKENNAIITFDPNVRLNLWNKAENCRKTILEFIPFADIIKISSDETEFITGVQDIEHLKEIIMSMGCKMILLTKGDKGATLITKDYEIDCLCPQVNTVDTTGAGDAFMGAFLYKLSCTNKSLNDITEDVDMLKDYAYFATCYASLSTITYGGAISMVDLPTAERFIYNKEMDGE